MEILAVKNHGYWNSPGRIALCKMFWSLLAVVWQDKNPTIDKMNQLISNIASKIMLRLGI